MSTKKIAGFGLLGVGAVGFLMNIDLWGVWLLAGLVVLIDG
jgi:preprotein translocase subunit Sss1